MNQVGAPGGNTQLFQWNNFFRGQANAPPPALYYNGSLTDGYQQAIDFANPSRRSRSRRDSARAGFRLPAGRAPLTGHSARKTSRKSSQKTDNAYAMLRFGQDEPIFGNVKLDGNIGVRFVRDTLASGGQLGIQSAQQLGLAIITSTGQQILQPFTTDPTIINPDTGLPVPGRCDLVIPPPPAPQVPTPQTGVCTLGPAGYAQLQQFAGTGTNIPDTARNKYTYWLPSANLKFGLSEDLIFRLAASRDFARPNLSDIRNFLNIGLTGGPIDRYDGEPVPEADYL